MFRARVIVSLCTDMRVARAIFQQLMTQGNMSTFYHWRKIRLLQGMSCARCVKLGFTFPDWNTSEHLCLRKLSKKLRNLWQRRSDCCVKRHNFSRRCLKFLQASFLDLISLIEALSGESFLNWKYCKRTERKVYAQPQILLCTQFLENNNDNGRVITTLLKSYRIE